MKFSYSLLKNLVPKISSKQALLDGLNAYSFEAEDLGGDTIEVSISPNRFSDAASHWGLAVEIAAILGVRPRVSIYDLKFQKPTKKEAGLFAISIKEKNLCPRYGAQYFENIKVKESPAWLKKILKDCGLRPINNVVDIMNYVMLETGQPLHAFDYDKLEADIADPREIIVRRAKAGEKIKTLDEGDYELNKDVLVIADARGPLAIAGIKGGKRAEVDSSTKRIIVEAANFDSVAIYKTAKSLNLVTDASIRFSHNLSPFLVRVGLARGAELLKESGARVGGWMDIYKEEPFKKIIGFDIEKFNHFIGVKISAGQASAYLKRLGFVIKKTKVDHLEIEIPLIRQDVESFEDLAEEVARLYGYNNLKLAHPSVALKASETEDIIKFKDGIRKDLIGLGLTEVMNYSFTSKEEIDFGDFWSEKQAEISNPVSSEFQYLRTSLAPSLLKNVKQNFKFFDSVKIFEIGKVFNKNDKGVIERWRLGIILGSKNKETVFELKGIVSQLLEKAGLVDYFMRDIGKTLKYLENNGGLRIESDHSVVGYLGKAKETKEHVSVAEIDLEKLLLLVEGELEFKPIPKYPSINRDISVLASSVVRVGDLLEAIELAPVKYVQDVDLIDEYVSEELGDDRQSLTFRIVFRADDHTLTDAEADAELLKIVNILKQKFSVEIR